MGRKPNQVIISYFHRGPKLADNSNRYPHTCKLCGEDFPKGRIDSLTNHITKPGKCPAITEADRIQACLALHSIPNPAAIHRKQGLQGSTQDGGAASHTANWTALEALAEASRQVNMSEKQDVGHGNPHPMPGTPYMGDQFVLDSSPVAYETPQPNKGGVSDNRDQTSDGTIGDGGTPTPPTTEANIDSTNLSVAAAAATARLNPSYLDPQLIVEEVAASFAPSSSPTQAIAESTPNQNASASSPPWGEITYLTNTPSMGLQHESPQTPAPMHRGGVRMDTGDGSSNGRPRNSRARFNPTRRKEVQEVRKIGACIRCRILRKNCGKGDPCDTCRKVLSPRVWRTGCVRTRLHEQLDLYSAGVQVVLAQRRYNLLKTSLQLSNVGTVVEASQFPESGFYLSVPVFRTMISPPSTPTSPIAQVEANAQALMIDCDSEDIPNMIERYMHEIMPVLIEKEPSPFVRTLLQTAFSMVRDSPDELLRGSLELWGLVEIIDRERQWSLVEKHPGDASFVPRAISDTTKRHDLDIYTIMCLQLNAAAERKANTTSKTLLSSMQRILQDSKVKIGFPMFLTALVFLNCVEKSTWGFKAWEQEGLRAGWPLEREPGLYTHQGESLANLLRMLLSIRRVLPPTERGADGKLMLADGSDQVAAAFYRAIDLDYDSVQTPKEFDPGNSRSLELAFCSHLLLPRAQGWPMDK